MVQQLYYGCWVWIWYYFLILTAPSLNSNRWWYGVKTLYEYIMKDDFASYKDMSQNVWIFNQDLVKFKSKCQKWTARPQKHIFTPKLLEVDLDWHQNDSPSAFHDYSISRAIHFTHFQFHFIWKKVALNFCYWNFSFNLNTKSFPCSKPDSISSTTWHLPKSISALL